VRGPGDPRPKQGRVSEAKHGRGGGEGRGGEKEEDEENFKDGDEKDEEVEEGKDEDEEEGKAETFGGKYDADNLASHKRGQKLGQRRLQKGRPHFFPSPPPVV
jgi:hypothetical protein